MDYTSSDAHVVDGATGQRMHQSDQPVTTAVEANDMNSVIWSLMEIVKDAGLEGIPFNKSDPESYGLLLKAMKAKFSKFDPTVNYAVGTLGWADLQGLINVSWFDGADKTGATDMTAIFDAAEFLGHGIFVPKGIWAINWVINRKIKVFGEGGNDTVITPFSTDEAAVTYRGGQSWTYETEFNGIHFTGRTGRAGVGYTAGATYQEDFEPGMEFHSNVRFVGCRFTKLDKAAQFPFGNIGKVFIECSWNDNNYDIYCLDNKTGEGNTMHAGNLLIYGGYMGGNKCGVYIHNRTEGFGGVDIIGTITEFGQIVAYVDTSSTFTPTTFRGIWNEGNGSTRGGSTPVSLDQWTGPVKSTQSVPLKALVFAGTDNVIHWEGGFLTDVLMSASDGVLDAYGARVEALAAAGGGAFSVTGSNSQIRLHNPYTQGGLPIAERVTLIGSVKAPAQPVSANLTDARGRAFLTQPRCTVQQGHGSAGVSDPLTKPAAFGSGSFNGYGTVVSDGVLYSLCNEFTIPFTSSAQASRLESSVVTAAAGWWVMTVDAKYVSGADVTLQLWDRSGVQAVTGMTVGATGRWRTLGGIFYSPGGQTWYLDIGGASASATFRLSAYQCRRFDTQEAARAFLESMAFVEPLAFGSTTYDPPSLADGAGVTTTVACIGARFGDFCQAAFSADLQGIQVSAWVSAADVVSVRLQNETGGAVDLAPGTLSAKSTRF